MAKARTTVTLDERVLRAVRIKAARTGRRDSDVIEEALLRDLGLDLLDRARRMPGVARRNRPCAREPQAP